MARSRCSRQGIAPVSAREAGRVCPVGTPPAASGTSASLVTGGFAARLSDESICPATGGCGGFGFRRCNYLIGVHGRGRCSPYGIDDMDLMLILIRFSTFTRSTIRCFNRSAQIFRRFTWRLWCWNLFSVIVGTNAVGRFGSAAREANGYRDWIFRRSQVFGVLPGSR